MHTDTVWRANGRRVYNFAPELLDELVLADGHVPATAVLNFLPSNSFALPFPAGRFPYPVDEGLEVGESWHPTFVDAAVVERCTAVHFRGQTRYTNFNKLDNGVANPIEPTPEEVHHYAGTRDATSSPGILVTLIAFGPPTPQSFGFPTCRYVNIGAHEGQLIDARELVAETNKSGATRTRIPTDTNAFSLVEEPLAAALGCALYLVQKHPKDLAPLVTPRPATRRRLTSKEEKLERMERLAPPVTTVGWTFAALLAQARKERLSSVGDGRTVTPHVRGPHFHLYRVGEGRKESRVHFLSPILVGTDDPSQLRGRVTKVPNPKSTTA
jgi:hypothetical protein